LFKIGGSGSNEFKAERVHPKIAVNQFKVTYLIKINAEPPAMVQSALNVLTTLLWFYTAAAAAAAAAAAEVR